MKYSRAEQEALDALWLSNLSHIKTFYGRLVYLAGLRNPDTGRYEHYGLTVGSNAGAVHRSFRRFHETIFREWVGISLEQKKEDVESYIFAIDQVNICELVDAWLRLTPYKNLVPASIQGPERHKHISDFEAILGLLKNLYGVASPDLSA
ncbi:MAG: hypothetical protein WA324_19035 [Bryobacteraceae bacterium]